MHVRLVAGKVNFVALTTVHSIYCLHGSRIGVPHCSTCNESNPAIYSDIDSLRWVSTVDIFLYNLLYIVYRCPNIKRYGPVFSHIWFLNYDQVKIKDKNNILNIGNDWNLQNELRCVSIDLQAMVHVISPCCHKRGCALGILNNGDGPSLFRIWCICQAATYAYTWFISEKMVCIWRLNTNYYIVKSSYSPNKWII